MVTFRLPSFLIFAVLLISCGKDLPELKGIDHNLWIQDKNACNGSRSKMMQAIDGEKEKLLVLKETQIVELLGRPDKNELYKRNQKFFFYYLSPGKLCNAENDSLPDLSSKLVIRFNAMGLAKEVSIE